MHHLSIIKHSDMDIPGLFNSRIDPKYLTTLNCDMFCIIIYMALTKQPTHQTKLQRGSCPFKDESH